MVRADWSRSAACETESRREAVDRLSSSRRSMAVVAEESAATCSAWRRASATSRITESVFARVTLSRLTSILANLASESPVCRNLFAESLNTR